MKKLKKLSVLVLLAAGFALAFSGCSNTKDETGTEQGGGAGSGDETGGTGGSNDGTENPGDSGSSGDNTGSNGDATGSGGDNSSGGQTGGDSTGSGGDNSNGGQTGGDTSGSGGGNNSGNTAKAGIIIGDTVYKFADLEITENYTNPSLIKKNSDGTLTVTAGSWDQFNIPLPTAINISGKKIAITAKVASDYEQGTGLFKLIFAESDDKQSEITANKAADGGNNEGWCDPLTTEFKTYTGPDVWAAYQKEAADLTKIIKIIINPQSGEGDITIQSIEFVD